ncbi:unnamed protein product [Protopolystoma xenopodis]|uniref:Uncharacterized protein n=1 Tax=Protopolystoma xenopodis TaxID=117903 RepID=A0A448XLN1_9PLAT|nr:unnamed protein product [Protopolystoma xenopodis]
MVMLFCQPLNQASNSVFSRLGATNQEASGHDDDLYCSPTSKILRYSINSAMITPSRESIYRGPDSFNDDDLDSSLINSEPCLPYLGVLKLAQKPKAAKITSKKSTDPSRSKIPVVKFTRKEDASSTFHADTILKTMPLKKRLGSLCGVAVKSGPDSLFVSHPSGTIL